MTDLQRVAIVDASITEISYIVSICVILIDIAYELAVIL